MIGNSLFIGAVAVVFILSPDIYARQKRPMDVNTRAELTGVSQNTIHHFELSKEGGLISVHVKDPRDAQSRDLLRLHMAHMAKMYAEGYFRGPEFIHAEKIPGVTKMKQLKAEIHYEYHDLDSGGQIRITSPNEKAIAAVHEFLRFQIKGHQTGDPIGVK